MDRLPFTTLGVARFRSFGRSVVRLNDIKKVNILVGRNNAGKSNFLRLMAKLNECTGAVASMTMARNLDPHIEDGAALVDGPDVRLVYTLEDLGLTEAVREAVEADGVTRIEVSIVDTAYNEELANSLVPIRAEALGAMAQRFPSTAVTGHNPAQRQARGIVEHLRSSGIQQLRSTFENLLLVPAVRSVWKGSRIDFPSITYDPAKAIEKLAAMQDYRYGEVQLRLKAQFDFVQSLVRELLGDAEIQLRIRRNPDEIIVTRGRRHLPLESYGDGIHQLVVLCAAIASEEDHIIAIEEPETHLHPSLQRQFMRMLGKTKNVYFITTHSNVLLDTAEDGASLTRVYLDGGSSRTEAVVARGQAWATVRSLGYRASDLVQTNGVVWVEGPSDRVYLNRWLELENEERGTQLREGIHYTILFYGGSDLAHLGGEPAPGGDALIDLLRVNQNAVVVMDSDKGKLSDSLKVHVRRIKELLGDARCWITDGREVENYVKPSRMAEYVSTKRAGFQGPISYRKWDTVSEKVDAALRSGGERELKLADRKAKHAEGIAVLMDRTDLRHRDLLARVRGVAEQIIAWNSEILLPTDQS